MVKNLPAKVGDQGSIPGEGNGYPLQYPCLGNLMDGGAWQATVHGVEKIVGHNLSTTQQQIIQYD